MNLQEAAKFLIVAWVKDWPLRTLLGVLSPDIKFVTDEQISKVVQAFPFMPSHIHWYVQNHGAGASTRRFVSDAFPRLNDALWDSKDDQKRLLLSAQVCRLSAGDIKQSTKLDNIGVKAMNAAKRAMRQESTSYRLSRDAFKTHQRSAWSVCK